MASELRAQYVVAQQTTESSRFTAKVSHRKPFCVSVWPAAYQSNKQDFQPC